MPPNSIDASFEILQCLKTATSQAHRRIEERVPVFDPAFDLVSYIRLLERYYGFWVPIEAKLLHLNSLKDPALAIQSRMKSHLLEADLRILGHEADIVPHCPVLPSIDTFPAGLGCLYVLEGSTLGARFISRRIESHLHLREDSGASFFNAYGETVGQRWSEFQSFVTAHVSVQDGAETVTAALQTFESLFDWLGEPIAAGTQIHFTNRS